MMWFATGITRNKLLPVLGSWLQRAGEAVGFNALLEGLEPTCVVKPLLIAQQWQLGSIHQ